MKSLSPAHVAAVRAATGLTLDQMASMLHVHPRTVRAWQSGRNVPSDSASAAISALLAKHTELVRRLATGDQGVTITREERVGDLPRGWWLAAAGQALAVNPAIEVEWGVQRGQVHGR